MQKCPGHRFSGLENKIDAVPIISFDLGFDIKKMIQRTKQGIVQKYRNIAKISDIRQLENSNLKIW